MQRARTKGTKTPWNREKTEMALEEENKSGSDGKKREKEREEEREFAKRGKVV